MTIAILILFKFHAIMLLTLAIYIFDLDLVWRMRLIIIKSIRVVCAGNF